MLLKVTIAAAITALAAQTATALPREGDVFLRIVGGIESPPGSFPFLVSLMRNGRHSCGGSLLNNNTVLTARHCVDKDHNQIQVRAGSKDRTTGGQVSDVIDVIKHPDFNQWNFDNDVAIVKISPAVDQNIVGEFARVAKKGSYPQPGKKRAAGWGQMEAGGHSTLPAPNKAREVELAAIPHPECQEKIPRIRVTRNMVCASDRDKDTCYGDSGGPLLDASTGELEGVTSWGGNCADQAWPSVYVAVGQLFDFISRHAGQLNLSAGTEPDQSNLDQSNLDQSNLDQSNLDQSNLDQDDFDQSNFDQSNFDQDGFDQSNFDQDDFDQSNFDQSNFDQDNFDQYNFDQDNFDPSEDRTIRAVQVSNDAVFQIFE